MKQPGTKTLLGIGLGLLLLGVIFLGRLAKKTPDSAAPTPGPPTTKWTLQVSKNSPLSEPAIGADGTIYVGGPDGLYAITPGGAVSWKFPTTGDAAWNAPAIARDGTVYFGTASGALYGISPRGQQSWHAQWRIIGMDGTPAVGHDGTLYVLNNAGDVFAWGKDESQPLWRWDTTREGITSEESALPGNATDIGFHSKASPAIGTDSMVYVARQDMLHSFSPSGEISWSINLPRGFLGPVAVGADGTIYVGSQRAARLDKDRYGARLFAVDRYGQLKWKLETAAAIVGAPVVDREGVIYVCAGNLLAVSPDGRLLWEAQPGGYCTSGPTLAEDGTIYLGWIKAEARLLVAVTSAGELKWSAPTQGIVRAAPAISPEGIIFVSTDGGILSALRDAGAGLMVSPWPKYQHDAGNSGRFHAPL